MAIRIAPPAITVALKVLNASKTAIGMPSGLRKPPESGGFLVPERPKFFCIFMQEKLPHCWT
jgi:hypothetical protein